jgi:hypothetical protein
VNALANKVFADTEHADNHGIRVEHALNAIAPLIKLRRFITLPY